MECDYDSFWIGQTEVVTMLKKVELNMYKIKGMETIALKKKRQSKKGSTRKKKR